MKTTNPKGTLENKDNVICRCEEVTEGEIRKVIREFDLRMVDDVKRLTRGGMGLCQGRTCERIIQRIMAEETGLTISELGSLGKRPPASPIEIGSLAGAEEYES